MIKNKKFALGFRIFALILSIMGIASHLGVFSGELKLDSVMFYTIQSNILAIVLFGVLTYRTITTYKENKGDGNLSYTPRFSFVCMVDLLLTMIVYWVLLAPTTFNMGSGYSLFTFNNLTLHLFVPLLCILDFFMFTKSKEIVHLDVYMPILFPLFYLILTSITGAFGYVFFVVESTGKNVHYPYFFMDYDLYGAKVLINVLVMTILFVLMSYLLYFINKKWKRD